LGEPEQVAKGTHRNWKWDLCVKYTPRLQKLRKSISAFNTKSNSYRCRSCKQLKRLDAFGKSQQNKLYKRKKKRMTNFRLKCKDCFSSKGQTRAKHEHKFLESFLWLKNNIGSSAVVDEQDLLSTERSLREEINKFVDAFGPTILGSTGNPTTEDRLFQAVEKCKVAAKVANAHYPEAAVDQRNLDRQILNSMLDDTVDFHIASLPQSTQAKTISELNSLRNDLNAIFIEDKFIRLIQKCQKPASALGEQCLKGVAAISQVGEPYEVAKCYDDLLLNLTRKHENLIKANAKAEAQRIKVEEERRTAEKQRKRVEAEKAAEREKVPTKLVFELHKFDKKLRKNVVAAEYKYSVAPEKILGGYEHYFESEKSYLLLDADKSKCAIRSKMSKKKNKSMAEFTKKCGSWNGSRKGLNLKDNGASAA